MKKYITVINKYIADQQVLSVAPVWHWNLSLYFMITETFKGIVFEYMQTKQEDKYSF